jgi:hypothetical protein
MKIKFSKKNVKSLKTTSAAVSCQQYVTISGGNTCPYAWENQYI